MDTNNAPPVAGAARYSMIMIALHWLIAALVIFEVGLGLNMEGAKGAAKFAIFQLHKSVGITILLLMLLRIVWRFHRRPPPLDSTGWERALAHGVHGALYVILLCLPFSGWVIVSASKTAVPTLLYGAVPWPNLPGFESMAAATKEMWEETGKFVHVNLVNMIYLLFALHIAGALKHHFIDRNGVLARMLPGVPAGSWRDPRIILIGLAAVGAIATGFGWQATGGARSAVGAGQPVAEPVSVEAFTPASSVATPPTAQTVATEADIRAAAEQKVSIWVIKPGSTLGFRTTWSGETIAGGFARFSGDIAFSPDQLDRSEVTINIDTGSVFSGDDQRDEALKGTEWFATDKGRNAVFKANRFRKTGADRYVASGTLRMKGTTLPISVPFTLRITGDEAIMQGSATIDRLTYRIGEGEYASTAEIPAMVNVDIAVRAQRK